MNPDGSFFIGGIDEAIESLGRVGPTASKPMSSITIKSARRMRVTTLWDMKTAEIAEIASAFGVHEDTVWKWHRTLNSEDFAALSSDKPGPKGGSKLTALVITHIQEVKRKTGLSNRRIGTQVGVLEFSVRRVLTLTPADEAAENPVVAPAALEPAEPAVSAAAVQEELPVLPAPTDRISERMSASFGALTEVPPAFAPAARVPLAGMFFALPALETTLLLRCAPKVFTGLSKRVYGLNTLLLEGVLRALVGEPRAEGATRLHPTAFGRILGMDRSPEVKTIRRQYQGLVDTGKVPELMSMIAFERFAADNNPDAGLLGIVYVDGHTSAYEGGKKIGRLHSTRLKMPVPATEETWVSAADGDPLFMVMAQPSASLVSEIKPLVPKLRAMIGDDRRMLVGFDRGGWSPTLFALLHQAGFDVLTWRKGATADVDEALFNPETYVDEHGTTHSWDRVADTEVEVVLSAKTGETFRMRQVSQIVPLTTRTGTRQVHILATLDTLDTQKTISTAEVVYRMAARWRQENYFRFGRERFALDAHDSYASGDDDATRFVPNPAKAKAKLVQNNARNYRDAVVGTVTAALLAINTPAPGAAGITITNQMHNDILAPPYWPPKPRLPRPKMPTGNCRPGFRWVRAGPGSRSWTRR